MTVIFKRCRPKHEGLIGRFLRSRLFKILLSVLIVASAVLGSLGAFEITPIELAGAYAAFANGGWRVQPHAVRRVAEADGREIKTYTYEPRQVLHPEIAYLITHLMEAVIDSGTGAGVRARGFKLPAAGKTGTSRDGGFAGYTKDLLVMAWVGFDDNRDLDLEGARSALPIWAEFMKKAYELNPVREPGHNGFPAAAGYRDRHHRRRHSFAGHYVVPEHI